MAWHRQGTVSVTNGSTTVTGSGTGWVRNGRVGDEFQGPDGYGYEVTNIAADGALSILPAYKGPTASGQSYALKPIQGYVKKSADELSIISAELGDKGTAYSRDVVTSNSDTTANRLLQVGATGAQLGADVYRRANIVGTVSQSGGVPTGAIIQRGSNANGQFTIFADGKVDFQKEFVMLQSAMPAFQTRTGRFGTTSGEIYFTEITTTLPISVPLLNRNYTVASKTFSGGGLQPVPIGETTTLAAVRIWTYTLDPSFAHTILIKGSGYLW